MMDQIQVNENRAYPKVLLDKDSKTGTITSQIKGSRRALQTLQSSAANSSSTQTSLVGGTGERILIGKPSFPVKGKPGTAISKVTEPAPGVFKPDVRSVEIQTDLTAVDLQHAEEIAWMTSLTTDDEIKLHELAGDYQRQIEAVGERERDLQRVIVGLEAEIAELREENQKYEEAFRQAKDLIELLAPFAQGISDQVEPEVDTVNKEEEAAMSEKEATLVKTAAASVMEGAYTEDTTPEEEEAPSSEVKAATSEVKEEDVSAKSSK